MWSDTPVAGRGRNTTFIMERVIVIGGRCLETHTEAKATRASPFGELRFYVIAKAASVGLGMRSWLEDIGASATVRVSQGSSTAKSISVTKRACRIRHVDVRKRRCTRG